MLTTTTIIVCSIATFIAGVIDSIAGGGGLITLPSMLLMGVPPHYALGTGKFASSIGTSLALFNFARNNLVLWRVAGIGVVFSLLGAYLGSLLALHLDSAIMGKVLVALLPVGMVATFIPKKESPSAPTVVLAGATLAEGTLAGYRCWLFVPLVSVAVGCYDGFFGPGAGSFFILAFHWILCMGLIQASATAKVFNLASNVGSLIAFLISGHVLFALAIPMAIASMLGNWWGSRMAIKAGAGIVRKFLLISLTLLLITLIWRFWFM